MTMNPRVAASLASLFTLSTLLVACSSDKKETKPAEPGATASASWTTTTGEAGGTAEETIQATAKVKAIDAKTRKITLTSEDGTDASFTAPAAMKNFDQLHVGDKVTATVNSRLVIYVRPGTAPDIAAASAVVTAPKGAKPGAIIAEGAELIATVRSIDTQNRNATIEFADGSFRTVPIRKDVDLSKYKAGDSVVIRVSQQLMVVAEKP